MLDVRQRAQAFDFFERALALPPERRGDFLAEHCDDSAVRHEVESLLGFAGRSSFSFREAVQEVGKDLIPVTTSRR